MLPNLTFIIRFTHREQGVSVPGSEEEFTGLPEAWEAFRLFAEPDSAELYSEIELVELNWATHTERRIAGMTLDSATGN